MASKRKKKKGKATLCLDGQSVQASGKKKKQLLKDGATPGACAATSPPPPPPGVPNAYGCLSINAPCTSASECCSNICESGVCRGHGAGTCDQDDVARCDAVNPDLARCNNSTACSCLETTGGFMFCGSLLNPICSVCRKDIDCLALGYPAGSSCIPLDSGLCAGVCESGMMCVPPCGVPVSM